MFTPSEDLARLRNVNRLIAKRDANDGIAIGHHGTSLTRALHVVECGFENRVPERSGFRDLPGVYFWDEEYGNNAFSHGEDAAKEDGDEQFAVIRARLLKPAPDYKDFRPQWRAQAADVGVVAVHFYNLSDRREFSILSIEAGSSDV